jgi:hypothetical protein
MRTLLIFCAMTALGCAEAKKQARLGLVGGASTAGPANPGMPNMMPVHPDPISSVLTAVGTAAASRAVGGCVSQCIPGTTCNERTGMCEVLPCRGQCRSDEVCENDRCVPGLQPNLKIDQRVTPE